MCYVTKAMSIIKSDIFENSVFGSCVFKFFLHIAVKLVAFQHVYTHLKMVEVAGRMIFHIKTGEEQRDGAVLRGLQYDAAFKIISVYVRPAWALEVTVFLFIHPAATCRYVTFRCINTLTI